MLFSSVQSIHFSMQPSGGPAVIKWITVGGRTSAYVPELQKLSSKGVVETEEGDSSALSSAPEDDEEDEVKKKPVKRKRAVSSPRRHSFQIVDI